MNLPWRVGLPDWLLPIAWERAGLPREQVEPALDALEEESIVSDVPTNVGQRGLALAHDVFCDLPSLPHAIDHIVHASGAADLRGYTQVLAEAIQESTTRNLSDALIHDDIVLRQRTESCLRMYLLRSALLPDAWPAFLRQDAFRVAVERVLYGQADLEPFARVARELFDRCHRVLDAASIEEATEHVVRGHYAGRARSLLRALLELQASAEARVSDLRVGFAPVVVDVFPMQTTMVLFERVAQLTLGLPAGTRAREIAERLDFPRDAAEAELAELWQQIAQIPGRRMRLWGHLVEEGSNAAFRDRYCFLIGQGDVHRDLGRAQEADNWYIRTADLASDHQRPLFALAAAFSSARSFRLNGEIERVAEKLTRCCEMSRELGRDPAWLEARCALLLSRSRLSADPSISTILQNAEEHVVAVRDRPGRPVLLITNEADLIGADAVARALSGITDLPVRLELAETAWQPEQVDVFQPVSLVIFGSVLARATGDLIRRFVRPDLWYPWTGEHGKWARPQHSDVGGLSTWVIGGRMFADTLQIAQDAAEDRDLLFRMCSGG